MSSPLHLKSILITGGAGAFGRAFVRRALEDGAKRVAVFSRDEVKHAQFRSELFDPRLRFMLGSVCDYPRVLEACRDVDIVIHAAAMKRVEMCEENPWQAVEANVVGTEVVSRACIAAGVAKAVLTSTDKAASPATLYGATKMVAERLWIQSGVYAAGTGTLFSASRYGNVAGSTGSVIPLWKKQRRTGEITLTDKRMTRFVMSMDEAVELVVLVLNTMRGGETLVPKIGAIKMTDLAKQIVPECRVKEIGIRPGEKLHETLIGEDEARRTFDAGTHYLIEPEARTWEAVLPPPYPKVPDGFVYRSDTARPLTNTEIQRAAA
jgi:UDP-N-acetylglucosamine 4,6-dehydratase/5-epimerase